jgi:ADP-ribosylglycohydrolase
MLGAIAGDIIGSVHEFLGGKTKEFPLFVEDSHFTDDTVLSIAVADCLLTGVPYVDAFRAYAWKYPDRGYGLSFWRWVQSGSTQPYNSWGNGSAMRVGAVAATFLARQHATKEQIRTEIRTRFGYSLSRTIDMIRPGYSFNESCQQTVPEAITAALDSTSYEDAIRLAISLGGDADTLACIAGGIAGAMYGVPHAIGSRALTLLDDELRKTVIRFCQRYAIALP